MAEPTKEEMAKANALYIEGLSIREVAEHFGWSTAMAKYAILKGETGKGTYIGPVASSIGLGVIIGIILLIIGL